MSSDFRHIATTADGERADRLFRASVSAFCSLSRPSKREINQLDDLTTPLMPLVSAASKRFVSAALSECRHVPPTLVHLLSEEPVEISAPLLVRSRALTDVDLIALIGRHGQAHARAIARRDNLNPTIVNLIRAMRAQDDTRPQSSPAADNAEIIRGKLRSIMEYHAARQAAREQGRTSSAWERLRSAALSGVADLFLSALAEELSVPSAQLIPLIEKTGFRDLSAVLRLIEFDADQAYLIVSALHPSRFPSVDAIRLFMDGYGEIDAETAAATLARLHPQTGSMPATG